MKKALLTLVLLSVLSGVAWAWCHIDYSCKSMCMNSCNLGYSECNMRCTELCMVCQ